MQSLCVSILLIFCVNDVFSQGLGSGNDGNSASSVRTEEHSSFNGSSSDACVLPPYPQDGRYRVASVQNPAPGQSYDNVSLTVFCNPGFVVDGISYLSCINGTWSGEVPRCIQCGTVTTSVAEFVVNGSKVALRSGDLPWYAAIYNKRTSPYSYLCGGSLVTPNVVISAAHCFWRYDDGLSSPSYYAVAVGKIFRHWTSVMDGNAQKTDVSDIKIPKRFRGSATNFQDDIALVFLSSPVQYNIYVRPVCVNFDYDFKIKQLHSGRVGKVPTWKKLMQELDDPRRVLKAMDLPFVDVETCLEESPVAFREYITSDKSCAGFKNGTEVCRGDDGGGLVFPEDTTGTLRYYLQGIVSIGASSDQNDCAGSHITITEIIKHQHFIIKNVFNETY